MRTLDSNYVNTTFENTRFTMKKFQGKPGVHESRIVYQDSSSMTNPQDIFRFLFHILWLEVHYYWNFPVEVYKNNSFIVDMDDVASSPQKMSAQVLLIPHMIGPL